MGKSQEKHDIGFYVVLLNRLVAELNKITRQTFNPNVDEIIRVSDLIKSNAESLKKGIKS